ncbi:MAG: hypothetical protein ACJA0N_001773 [Pseudohongiellaceae bacterium]|jgi:hypothetical protein
MQNGVCSGAAKNSKSQLSIIITLENNNAMNLS